MNHIDDARKNRSSPDRAQCTVQVSPRSSAMLQLPAARNASHNKRTSHHTASYTCSARILGTS